MKVRLRNPSKQLRLDHNSKQNSTATAETVLTLKVTRMRISTIFLVL
jgi:hypothetical protein